MSPNEVNYKNEQEIARRMYLTKPKLKWKYKIGDKVRLIKHKHVFEKGYVANWPGELFTIIERLRIGCPIQGDHKRQVLRIRTTVGDKV